MRRSRNLAVAVTLALLAVAPAGQAQQQTAGGFQVFTFSKVNGVYSNPDPDITPVQRGPVTVTLRSPSNEVELRENRLLLKPAGGGLHLAWLTLEVQGQGDLEADLDLGPQTSRMKDVVILPPQTVVVEGKIRLERVENGYLATAVELPKEVKLEIRSQVAASLVETCGSLALFMPLGSACGELQESLEKAAVPMPPPGETLLLQDAMLTEEERRQLDLYLAGSAG